MGFAPFVGRYLTGKRWHECAAIAVRSGHEWFVLEYPPGFMRSEEAACGMAGDFRAEGPCRPRHARNPARWAGVEGCSGDQRAKMRQGRDP